MTPPSYHDLYITTADLPRTRISNLPFSYLLTCDRVGGWALWPDHHPNSVALAGEYNENGLRLDVDGRVICDSLTTEEH